jgi:RNA polymerase sigma factor (sigma-70 family)
MRHFTDDYIYCSAFLPVLSLDQITSGGCETEEGHPSPTEIEDPSTNPEALALKSEVGTAVRSFVNELTPREKSIVHKLFWNGETQVAVARELGVSRMAVCKALARVVKRGKEKLAGFEEYALAS